MARKRERKKKVIKTERERERERDKQKENKARMTRKSVYNATVEAKEAKIGSAKD